jgi:hypothetical protein
MAKIPELVKTNALQRPTKFYLKMGTTPRNIRRKALNGFAIKDTRPSLNVGNVEVCLF